MSDDLNRQARQLSDAWDQVLAGTAVDSPGADAELVGTLREILALHQADAIDDRLQGAIWANVLAGTAELWRPDEAILTGQAAVRPARASTRLSIFLLRFAWIVLAGFTGGFIAGIGARLFMRVAGALTIEDNRSILTNNEERVGEITVAGTLSLAMLAGGAGIVAMLIYLLLRKRLPFAGWQRSAVFAVILLLVFGFVLMDPSNPDYNRFGPAWLNVSMFSSLYLLLGFFTSWFYELGRARQLPERVLSARMAIRIPIQLASAVIGLVGLLICSGALFLGALGLFLVIGLGIAAWLSNRYVVAPGLLQRLSLPAAVQPLGLMVVPGIVGFVLTARGITEILMN